MLIFVGLICIWGTKSNAIGLVV